MLDKAVLKKVEQKLCQHQFGTLLLENMKFPSDNPFLGKCEGSDMHQERVRYFSKYCCLKLSKLYF
jgi:hypothetical protein